MRYPRPLLLATICSCSFLYACMKHDPDTKNCSLSTGTYTTTAAGKVTYRLTHDGAAIIDSLTYYGANGQVKVKEPAIPFTITVDLPAGATVGITAAGTAIKGRFSIEYAHASTTDTTTARDVCIQ